MKTCQKCCKSKSLSHFPIRGVKADGSPSYRSFCRNCWNEIRRSRERKVQIQDDDSDDILIQALASFVEQSPDLLETITKEDFIEYTGYNEPFSFTEIKEKTFKYLDSIGVGNPASITITDDANYLIIGDTYGQHTRSGMFSLINNICKAYDVKGIIAIGRQLDENGNISNCFESLPVPVIFVSTPDEVSALHKLNEKIHGTICRESVVLNRLTVRNQEQITPYVKKAITSLDPLIFKGDCIVNCTRQEFGRRNASWTTSYIASPGTLAEPFVPKIQNKLLLKGGITVAQVYSKSFKKYRKMEEDKLLWQHGCVIVNPVWRDSPIFLPIKKVNGKYTTAFNGKVITEDGVVSKPTFISVVASDIHAPMYDDNALKYFLSYLNTRDVNYVGLNGDIADMRAFNPHVLSKGQVPDVDALTGFRSFDNVLHSIRAAVGDETEVDLILGNHSDFMNRFTKSNPQFETLFETLLYSITRSYNMDVYDVDDYSFVANNVRILHGNSFVAANGVTNTERVARAFGESVIGHSHSTNLRFGCLRTGCLCAFDQGYNSPYGNWDHSFATITSYDDVDFISPVFITDDGIYLGDEVVARDDQLLIEKSYMTVTL